MQLFTIAMNLLIRSLSRIRCLSLGEGVCFLLSLLWVILTSDITITVQCLCVCAGVAQLCPTLCDPTDHSSPGSSVHEILQARILGCHSLLHDCEVAFNNQRKKTSANYSPSDHPSIWKHLLKFSWSFLEMRVVFLSLQDRGKWHWLL